MKNGHVSLGETRMQYVSFGHGARRLVVLPGLSDGLATVEGKALALSLPYLRYLGDYTVYLFSRKDRMPEGYTIEDMADDQAAAMDALGIRRASVLGVSQGGMIAQALALRHPERVEKLILAVTASWSNDTLRRAVGDWIGMAQRGDHRALMVDTAERTYSEAYLGRSRALFPLLAKVTKPRSYERFLRNAEAILAFDLRGQMGEIRCPTLILAGSEDRTLGTEAAGELHREIRGSELFVYPGLGHGAYEEAKDFYARVFDFCGREDPEREGRRL